MAKNYFFDDSVEFAIQLSSSRTGTFLFHSIVDGHKEVASFPIVDYIASIYKDKYYYNKDNYIKYFLTLGMNPISPQNHLSDISYDFDKDLFLKEFNRLVDNSKEKNLRVFIEASYFALCLVRKIDLSRIKVVYIHCHDTSFLSAHRYLSLFPNAKFIFLLRNPLEALISAFYKSKVLDIMFISALYYINCGYFNFKSFTKNISSSNFISSKLEDLKKDHISTINNIANFLKISKNDILYQSTMGLKPYKQNSVKGSVLNGFSYSGGG